MYSHHSKRVCIGLLIFATCWTMHAWVLFYKLQYIPIYGTISPKGKIHRPRNQRQKALLTITLTDPIAKYLFLLPATLGSADLEVFYSKEHCFYQGTQRFHKQVKKYKKTSNTEFIASLFSLLFYFKLQQQNSTPYIIGIHLFEEYTRI